MNIKKIKELIELMNENGLAAVEVEQEGMKVKLTKNAYGAVEQTVIPVSSSGPALSQEKPQEAEEKKNGTEVKAPMVGTFYRSASPEIDPYVEVGDVVKKGDVLCIVEAMKLMNEVKAEFSGKVTEVLVENAESVEFGQVMFLVEPA